MTQQVVTLNAGSSSIKFAVFDQDGGAPTMIAAGLAEMVGAARHILVRDRAAVVLHEEGWSSSKASSFHVESLRRVLAWRAQALPNANVAVAGHRVVHGGVHLDRPLVVTDRVLAELSALVPLAPAPPAAQHRRNRRGAGGLARRAASGLF
jgi:acetate kinase